MSLTFVSVIIPVYNDLERLAKCLRSLSEQTYSRDRYEIIVVDNNSTEDIRSITDKFPKAVYSVEPSRGPAAARNKGIQLAKGEILAFIDSDCVPEADWIEKGVEKIRSIPDCGFVGGRIELYYRNPGKATAIELYDTLSYLLQQRYVEKYNFSATANMFTFKNVFQKVGVFNSELFKTASGEDAEWGERVLKAGYKQVYAKEVLVLHPATNSMRELVKKTIRITKGNMINNRTKGEGSFKDSLKSFSDSIVFSYKSIWKGNVLKSYSSKIGVSFLAAAMIIVKIYTRIRV